MLDYNQLYKSKGMPLIWMFPQMYKARDISDFCISRDKGIIKPTSKWTPFYSGVAIASMPRARYEPVNDGICRLSDSTGSIDTKFNPNIFHRFRAVGYDFVDSAVSTDQVLAALGTNPIDELGKEGTFIHEIVLHYYVADNMVFLEDFRVRGPQKPERREFREIAEAMAPARK